MKMMTKVVAVLAGLATALLLSVGFASTATAKPRPALAPSAPITTTLADGTAVAGTFDVQKFVVQNGALQAVGTFTGTVISAPLTKKLTVGVVPPKLTRKPPG